MSAAVIATFVALMTDLVTGETGQSLVGYWLAQVGANKPAQVTFMLGLLPLLSVAMVSNFVYRSHKVLKIHGVKPFRLLAGLVFVVAVLAYQPELFGFLAAFGYAVSGPIEWLLGWKKISDDDDIFAPIGEDESVMEPGDDVKA
jgi:CDP-diacylglycerol--serine O-phosphatidyltransferase